jgi:hypothetical protein
MFLDHIGLDDRQTVRSDASRHSKLRGLTLRRGGRGTGGLRIGGSREGSGDHHDRNHTKSCFQPMLLPELYSRKI